jgi:methylmalonic aciduria homocystinuria type C protein
MSSTMHPPPLEDSIAAFAQRCGEAGFDLVQPFSVAAHNSTASRAQQLGTFGRPKPLGLIVGNTRYFWRIFREAVDADPSLRNAVNPVDDYTEARIGFATAALGRSTLVSYVHVVAPAPLPIQRIAHAAGVAFLSPSHLSIHPTYGPWIAFRAAIVVDEDEIPVPAPPGEGPCERCAKPCLPALEVAVKSTRDPTVTSLGNAWPLWTKVRDACPVGKSHRYGEDQIRYHYAKDRTVLGPTPRARLER